MKKIHPLTITPYIQETAKFYTTLFGFEEVFSADWYIQLAHSSGMEIALMLPDQSNQPDFLHDSYSGKGIVYTFEVENATELYETLKGKDVPFVYELRDEEWGQRHFMLKDPAGVVVDVVEYLS